MRSSVATHNLYYRAGGLDGPKPLSSIGVQSQPTNTTSADCDPRQEEEGDMTGLARRETELCGNVSQAAGGQPERGR